MTNAIETIITALETRDANKVDRATFWGQHAGTITTDDADKIVHIIEGRAKAAREQGNKKARGLSQADVDGMLWAASTTATQYAAIAAKAAEIKSGYKLNETGIGVRIAKHLKVKKPNATQIEAAYQAALKADASLGDEAAFVEVDAKEAARNALARMHGDSFMAKLDIAAYGKTRRSKVLDLVNRLQAELAVDS